MGLRHVFLGAAVVALTSCAIPQNATNGITFEVEDTRLMMAGTITSRTPSAFRAALQDHAQITTVVMTQVLGSYDDEAVAEMGYAARRAGLNTFIPANGEVNSGGVDFFLAGVKRTVAEGAFVGVHSWADGFGEGARYPRGAAEHQLNVQYITDMLGSDAFYWFTLAAAPSDSIHEMTRVEMRRFGLIN